mmetsp:Transcript_39607/g.115627  ORF Transcript_39607/g.115627 Transcript_39607/m.115627 type:complete len:84 (+) Transcript_39607:287-538(+)
MGSEMGAAVDGRTSSTCSTHADFYSGVAGPSCAIVFSTTCCVRFDVPRPLRGAEPKQPTWCVRRSTQTRAVSVTVLIPTDQCE